MSLVAAAARGLGAQGVQRFLSGESSRGTAASLTHAVQKCGKTFPLGCAHRKRSEPGEETN
jgi:hypothetical protein